MLCEKQFIFFPKHWFMNLLLQMFGLQLSWITVPGLQYKKSIFLWFPQCHINLRCFQLIHPHIYWKFCSDFFFTAHFVWQQKFYWWCWSLYERRDIFFTTHSSIFVIFHINQNVPMYTVDKKKRFTEKNFPQQWRTIRNEHNSHRTGARGE